MDADQGLRPPAGSITIEREGADRRVLCLRGDVDTAVATRFTSAQGRERVVVDANAAAMSPAARSCSQMRVRISRRAGARSAPSIASMSAGGLGSAVIASRLR